MGLRERFSGDDDITKHRRDFDWLLEAVTKVTQPLADPRVFKSIYTCTCMYVLAYCVSRATWSW